MLRVTVVSFAEARDCPFRNVLDKLGDKWSFLILAVLEDQPQRFNAIKRLVGDISQRVLTRKLRDLERDGYVSRRVYPNRPPKVVYALTRVGRSALKPIAHLMDWSLAAHPQILRSRARYDNEQGRK